MKWEKAGFYGNVVSYSKNMKIVNLDQLPGGLRANYLECIHGEGNVLIAKRWRRSIPKKFEFLVRMR